MAGKADLHIHTTASDGALSPARVVEIAAEKGLAAISITDHDTVDGVEEALQAAKAHRIEVVPGIELSTTWEGIGEVHVLGYFVDHTDRALLQTLQTLKSARFERGRRMVERLNEAGIPVSFERVTELARGGAIGRPHVAKALCEAGAASSIDSAFGKFLLPGGIGFVPRLKVTPSEAVRMVLEAGGVPCLAHVAKLGRDELIVELMKQGLRAIEVFHPDHGPAASRFYLRFAEKHGLIATGGSDAHCHDETVRCDIGGITVSLEIVDQLRAASGRRGAAAASEEEN